MDNVYLKPLNAPTEVAAFLYGSPIRTQRSDEDWLVVTTGDSAKTRDYRAPKLVGQREVSHQDVIYRSLGDIPDLFYDKPFYHVNILFSNECYMDSTVEPQFREIISRRDDIVKMNPSQIAKGIEEYIKRAEIYMRKKVPIEYRFRNKTASKIVGNCIFGETLSRGVTYEEALCAYYDAAKPIKLGEIPWQDVLKLIKEHKEKFNNTLASNYWKQEPDRETYEWLRSVVASIDCASLTGIPIRG